MMGIKRMDKQDICVLTSLFEHKTSHIISYCSFSPKPKQYLAQNFLLAAACER
jgi:hypothetical protein